MPEISIPASVALAPVDFEKQELRDQLSAGGFRFDQVTWFSWLSVVPYLTCEAFRATAAFIAGMPAGSGVVFDYAPPASEMSFARKLALNRLAERVAAAGEPLRLFFKPAEPAAELRSLGFAQITDLDACGLNRRCFFDREDRLKLWGAAHLISARV